MGKCNGLTTRRTNTRSHFFGTFDDMVIGDRQQVRLPEPGVLSLLSLALFALGFLRFKRK